MYVKNDETYLYFAVVVEHDDRDLNDFATWRFDNDHDGYVELGDDGLRIRGDGLSRDRYRGYEGFWQDDTYDGGTDDIVGNASHTNPVKLGVGDYTFEAKHPLDTADNDHDFSLKLGDTVGFQFRYDDGGPGEGGGEWPTTYGNIIIALPPPPTYTLLVRVRDEENRLIEGAPVYLDDEIVGWTSVEGVVTVKNIPDGTHSIIATKSGYIFQGQDLSVTSDMEINIVLESCTLSKKLSNLAIHHIGLSSYEPVKGEEVEVKAVVINKGDAEAGAFFISLQADGEELANERIQKLSPGERKTTEFAWIARGLGDHELALNIDSNNEVEESNEEDNTQTQRLQVKMMKANTLTPWVRREGRQGESTLLDTIFAPIEGFYIFIFDTIDSIIHAIQPKPDLVVTEVVVDHVVSEEILVRQEHWDLAITIENIGATATEVPFVVGVFIQETGTHNIEEIYSLEYDEPLPQGQSFTFTVEEETWTSGFASIERFWSALSQRLSDGNGIGQLRIVVKVDEYGDVVEMIEDNNERSGPAPLTYVSGNVRDADGCPIHDATVLFHRPWTTLPTPTIPWNMVSDNEGSYVGVLIARPSYTIPISTREWPEGVDHNIFPSPHVSACVPLERYPWLDQMNVCPRPRYRRAGEPWLAPPPEINTYDVEMAYRPPDPSDFDGVDCEVERHLAEEYNPIYRFDMGLYGGDLHEQDAALFSFFPADPERYIEESQLWFLDGTTESSAPIDADPDVGTLNYPENHFLSLDKEGLGRADFLANWDPIYYCGANDPSVYAQVYVYDYDGDIHPNDLEYGIRYFLFYEYNPHPDFPDHECDWEPVCVYVQRGLITHMHFHKHGFKWRQGINGAKEFAGVTLRVEDPDNPGHSDPDFLVDVDGTDVEKIGKHPVVYVAMGSHASYHFAGETSLTFIPVSGDYADVAAAIANTGVHEDAYLHTYRAHPPLTLPEYNPSSFAGTDYHRGDADWYHELHELVAGAEGASFNIHLMSDDPEGGTLDYDLSSFGGKWGCDWVRYLVAIDWWYDKEGVWWLSSSSPGGPQTEHAPS